jgi:hypothetical protein
MPDSATYRDALLAVDDGRLTIRRYYFPLPVAKRIALADVREAVERPIGWASGQLRIWGSGDLRCWWNLDPRRVRKTRMFAIETGARICPAVTPDDPQRFGDALTAAGVLVHRES